MFRRQKESFYFLVAGCHRVEKTDLNAVTSVPLENRGHQICRFFRKSGNNEAPLKLRVNFDARGKIQGAVAEDSIKTLHDFERRRLRTACQLQPIAVDSAVFFVLEAAAIEVGVRQFDALVHKIVVECCQRVMAICCKIILSL